MVITDCSGKDVNIYSAHVEVQRSGSYIFYTVYGEYVGCRLCVLRSFSDVKSALDYLDRLKEAIALNEDYQETELRDSESDLPFAGSYLE